ncbi:MAG: hypothetical protein K0U66_05870, partial [Gammaproteobacteria bacterium]|nr:hypothetical protein [Gammaproteobacteria bacterium]
MEISTIEGLAAIRSNLDGNFLLTRDLDFTDPASYANGVNAAYVPMNNNPLTAFNAGFPNIGDRTNPFTGTFDGGGFTIRNLYARGQNRTLFGAIRGATIRNLGVNGYLPSGSARGLIVGIVFGGTPTEIAVSSLQNCYAAGTILSTFQGARVGGLVGNTEINSELNITNCYSTASVAGRSLSGAAGGLVGASNGPLNITNSYATGRVTGLANNVGGLVGSSRAVVTVTNSYWDSETSAQTKGIGDAGSDQGTALTSSALRSLAIADATGWSANDWDVGMADQYPSLRTYAENGSGVQIAGTHLTGQPCPRVNCLPPPPPLEISTIEELDAVRRNTNGNFLLTRDLDFTDPLSYASGIVNESFVPIGGDPAAATNAGFPPIGTGNISFVGTFDGGGFA